MHGGTYAEIVLIADRELRVKAVEAAAAAEQFLADSAIPASRMVGAQLTDCINGLDSEEAERVCHEILGGRPTQGNTLCFRRVIQDSRIPGRRWVVMIGPVAGKNGSVDGLVYARLRADAPGEPLPGGIGSDSLYETLVENASDVIFLLDAEGVIAFVNRRVEDYAGLNPDTLIGSHFSSVVHPEDLERCSDKLGHAMRSGEPFRDFSFRAVIPSAGVRYLVANGRPIRTVGSTMLLGICRDVTESVELNSELLARNEALSALNSIVVAVSSAGSLEQGLRDALNRIASVLGAPGGAVLLRNAAGSMYLAVHEGFEDRASGAQIAALGRSLSAAFQEIDDTVFVPDVASSSDLPDDLRAGLVELGVSSGAAIPLKCADAVTAVLALALHPPGDLSREQKEFLSLAAGILGPPIENARLHSDLADRASQLAMLERMARSISAGWDVLSTLAICMREIVGLVDYDHAAVVLVDRDGATRLYPFARGGEALPASQISTPVGWLDEIVSSREPIVLPHPDSLGAFHASEHFQTSEGSGAVAPMVYQGEGVGLLKVWSNRASAFGVRELGILSAAAEHLAIAVCNARLHEAERGRALELQALAKEAQHRIKNNLQMIAGLLGMSGRDPESQGRPLARCLRQINAIAAVHDLLSAENMDSKVGLLACLTSVAEGAITATGRSDEVGLTVSGEDCVLTPDAATAIGVIVNELVTNAVMHGLAGRDSGKVSVRIIRSGGRRAVEVEDDGIGITQDTGTRPRRGPSRGLELVASLARFGLGGELEITSSGCGTTVRVIF